MLDLDALAALTEQAVGGAPWMAVNANEGDPIEYGPFWVVGTGIPDDDAWFAEIHVGRYEDAKFIAAIRNAAPELIAELRVLRTAVERALAEAGDEDYHDAKPHKALDALRNVRAALTTPTKEQKA